MRLILAVALTCAMLTACSKPQDVVLPSDMSQLATIKDSMKKLSEEERRLLLGYIARKEMGKALAGMAATFGSRATDSAVIGIPPGTTIGQAIADQRQFIANQASQELEAAALKAKVEAENKAAADKINSAVTVSLVDMGLRKEDYQDEQYINVAVQNKSELGIKGLKGNFQFINTFGETVGNLIISVEESIAPGQIYVWKGSRRYNQFMDEHKKIAGLETGKFTTRFEPMMIVFEDGSKIGSVD